MSKARFGTNRTTVGSFMGFLDALHTPHVKARLPCQPPQGNRVLNFAQSNHFDNLCALYVALSDMRAAIDQGDLGILVHG